MGDLTIKVIDLLEDPTLDTTRLTQYITILRLMKAPKEKVLKKFIHAHEVRSKKLVEGFGKSVQDTGGVEDGGGVSDGMSMATHMREFHQTMLASLIEACMGFKELYSEGDGADAERSKALPGFLSMLNKMSSQYESVLLGAFTRVFSSVNRMCSTLHYEVDEDKMDVDFLSESKALDTLLSSTASTSIDTNENRFAVAELRNSLIMLSRLCIQDVKYLQSVMDGLTIPSSSPSPSPPVAFATQFTSKLMGVLHTHTQHVLQHDLHVYVQEMCSYTHKLHLISQAGELCNAHTHTHTPSSYATVLGRYVGKGGLSCALHFMKTCEDFLFTTICEIFTQTVLSFKSVVEIYESIMKDTQDTIQDLVRQFIHTLCRTILQSVGDEYGGEVMGVDRHTLSVLFSEHEDLVLTDETGEIIHETHTQAQTQAQNSSSQHGQAKQGSMVYIL